MNKYINSTFAFLAFFSGLICVQLLLGSSLIANLIVLLIFASLVFFEFEKNLKIFYFIVPSLSYFASIGFPGNPITYYLILLFIKYIIVSANKQFVLANVLIALVVVCLELSHLFFDTTLDAGVYFRWSVLFLFAVLLMSEKSSERFFSDYAGYFVAGYFSSSLLGLIIFLQGNGHADSGNIIQRFSGLSGDPNSYGMYSLLVLSFVLPTLGRIKESLWSWLFVFLVSIFSLLTVSRTFLICYALILFVCFYSRIWSKNALIITLLVAVIGSLWFWLGDDYVLVNNYVARFSHSDVSALTGSRSDVLVEYVNGFFGLSVLEGVFGAGVNSYIYNFFYSNPGFNNSGMFSEPIGPHNTIIELFVSFGLLGGVIFFWLMARCIFNECEVSKKNLNVAILLPLIGLLLYSFALQNLGQYSFYFLLFLVSMRIKEKSFYHGRE